MAKSSTFNISVKLLTQQFNKGIKDIQRQIRGVGSFIKGAFALGSITAFGKQMMQTAMEFEDAMAKVRAVSNASDRELEMMTDEAKKLGETTRYTAIEAAGALENLTRNGMSASQATQALGGTLKLAQANSIGLAEAADIVSNTLNMFNLKATETSRVNDVLSATSANSATDISLLYEALVNAAPAANVLGIGIEETAAAIGALAQKGVKGANAGTALRMALTKMVDPKIVAKMNSMGVAIDEQVIKQEGLLGVVKRLKDANLDLGQAVEIFSQRGAVGIQQLIGAYDDLELMLAITRNSAGTTDRMFQQGVGSTRAAIDTLKSTYESFLRALGDKTSGVVKGVIKYLTDLINNFKSVGGTIANLANVIIPLFTKMVVSSMTTFKTLMAQGAAAATELKAAIGGWVTILVTAVTWLGTYLYTAWSKNKREAKLFNEELKKCETETERLKTNVTELTSKLGKDTDVNTLAGVVNELTRLFPEFKEEITKCAAEARKTGDYDKLKGVLEDIITLQNMMRVNSVIEGRYQKLIEEGGKRMAKASKKEMYDAGLGEVYEYMRKKSKEDAELIYSTILDMRIRGFSDSEIATTVERLTGGAVKGFARFNANMIKDLHQTVGEGRGLLKSLQDNKEDQRNAEAAIEQLREKQRKEEEEAAEAAEKAAKAAEEAANKKKKEKDEEEELANRIKQIDEEFNRAVADAQDDLNQGYTDMATYLNRVADALKTAYEKLRAVTGATGADNKYKAPRDHMEKRVKDYKEYQESDLPKLPTITPPQGGLVGMDSHKQEVDVEFLGKAQSLQNWVSLFGQSVEAADTLTYSLQGLESAWDTLGSSSSSAIDKFSASIQVMKNIASMTQGLVQILDILGVKELWEARIHEWATKKKLRDDSKSVVGSIAKAIVGAIASVVEIPVVGPILAVAAAAGILGLIAATVPKFASGGIISGGSAHGDRNIARVNSGEMILNKGQQRRLLDIANGASTGGGVGQVEFYISGKNLKGVLRNVDAANSRISGAAGL